MQNFFEKKQKDTHNLMETYLCYPQWYHNILETIFFLFAELHKNSNTKTCY